MDVMDHDLLNSKVFTDINHVNLEENVMIVR